MFFSRNNLTVDLPPAGTLSSIAQYISFTYKHFSSGIAQCARKEFVDAWKSISSSHCKRLTYMFNKVTILYLEIYVKITITGE